MSTKRDAKLLKEFHYVRGGTVPKSIPAGRVLVHNHIRHTARTPCGERGFRAWTQKLEERLERCECGYAGLPHYRVKRAFRS
jgi:hypothetical protein